MTILRGDDIRSVMSLRDLGSAMAIAVITGLAAYVTLSLTRDFGRVSPVWLANAPALVLLLCTPVRKWPLLMGFSFSGNLAANLWMGDAAPAALWLSLLNAGEVILCAMAVRRWCGPRLDLSDARHLIIFLAVVGVTPVVIAFPAAAGLQVLGIADFGRSFLLWATADSLGLLILVPVLLAFLGIRDELSSRPFSRRAVIALLVLVAVTIGVFGQSRYPLLFLVPPALLLITVEMERFGAAVGMVIIAATAIPLSLTGGDPLSLASANPEERAVVLQVFLALCTVVGLATASLLTQWRRLRRSLQSAYDEAQIQSRRTAMAEQVAGVGHWRMDLATGHISWSSSLFDLFGVEGNGFTLAMSQQLVHPDDLPTTHWRLAAVKSGQAVPDTVMRIIRSTGEMRYVLARIVGETGPDGQTSAVMGTLVDITAQKEAELLISRSEERYRRLAENVSDVIATYTPEGMVRYLSPSVHGLLGYRPDELIGQNISSVINPDDHSHARAMYAAYLNIAKHGAPAPHVEYRAIHKDGHFVWVEAHLQAIFGPDGELLEVQDAWRDVTSRKAIAAELEAARRAAEDAAQVKGEFLANMSHELRTPLTSILGFTRLAAEDPTLVGAPRTYVTRVTEASQALLTTVNDILDFSQVEAGALVIRPEPFSPLQISQGTLELFKPQADAKGLDLVLQYELDEAAVVLADPARVRQVLLNLLGNAVKFTTEGSVRVVLRHDGADLHVAVTDTGEGMTADACERLFRRFSQVDGSSTRIHGGTGLGLAICKGLVEAMGGRIGVESAPGQGSRFWFQVPAPSVQDVAEAAPAAEPGVQEGMERSARILVVDDNPANRELGRLFLDAIGANVTEAASGAEALRLTQDQPFDVILMDIRMPGMDGWQTAAAIRAQGGPNAGTPILAFTANAPDHSEDHFRQAGFQGVVAKPLDARALLTNVLEALALAGDKASAPVSRIAAGS